LNPHQASRNLEAQRAIAAAEQLLLEQVRSPLIAFLLPLIASLTEQLLLEQVRGVNGLLIAS